MDANTATDHRNSCPGFSVLNMYMAINMDISHPKKQKYIIFEFSQLLVNRGPADKLEIGLIPVTNF